MTVVEGAVADALRLGAIGYDAVKHLTLCRVERRLPRLELTAYPVLPAIMVETPSPATCRSLLAAADAGASA